MLKALAAAGVLAALVAAAVVVLLHRGSKSTEAVAPTRIRATLAPGVLPRPASTGMRSPASKRRRLVR